MILCLLKLIVISGNLLKKVNVTLPLFNNMGWKFSLKTFTWKFNKPDSPWNRLELILLWVQTRHPWPGRDIPARHNPAPSLRPRSHRIAQNRRTWNESEVLEKVLAMSCVTSFMNKPLPVSFQNWIEQFHQLRLAFQLRRRVVLLVVLEQQLRHSFILKFSATLA